MEKDIAAVRRLLTIIVIPLVLYLLKILSFIFIPLAFGIFGALLFSPLMRWFEKKKLPRILGVITVVVIVSVTAFAAVEVILLASEELESADANFTKEFNQKLDEITDRITITFDLDKENLQEGVFSFFKNEKVLSKVFDNLSTGINIAKDLVSNLTMSIFFLLLLLLGSANLEKIMGTIVFKNADQSKTTFIGIEKDIFMFVIVKFALSLLTGIFFTIVCYAFGVSFPIFWGVIAFFLNFIQLIGSVVAVVALTLFAMVELGLTGSLLFFGILLIGIEVIIGGVIEPILMGKSFAINTISILLMLAIWGFIWGIPGMILAIPITVFLKKILERFDRTKIYAELLS